MITSDVAKGRCLLCRAPSCGCGPTTDVEPVDVDVREEPPVAGEKLKEYEVQQGRTTVTMQLNERDAKRLGATEVKKSQPASNKKRITKSDG